MTTRELDQLVSRTYLTPINKFALREVRRAIVSGRASDPDKGEAEWTIGIETRGGSAIRFHFSLKKVA